MKQKSGGQGRERLSVFLSERQNLRLLRGEEEGPGSGLREGLALSWSLRVDGGPNYKELRGKSRMKKGL